MKALAFALALAACAHPPATRSAGPPPPPAGSVTAMRWVDAGEAHWGISLEDGHFTIDLAREPQGVLELVDGRRSDRVGRAAEKTVGALEPAPELEALDREFAARSAAEGGDAWPSMFADDGAEWSNGKRVEKDSIGTIMRRVLAGANMTWQPIASGKAGALGFTVGTYVLQSRISAEHETGSYCTVWRRGPDGAWKIALDVGSTTTN